MRQESFYRSNRCPVCPVCSGRHYPATNGAGRRVHCDGSPAETKREQTKREREQAREAVERIKRQEQAHEARKREQAERRKAKREADRARLLIQAEHATRPDAAPIDATLDAGRIPDTLPDSF